MDAHERRRLIEQYREGPQIVVEALEGINDDELDRSAEDGWTPRQIVHHLADSEMNGATRVRMLVALDKPTIQGYDEKLFADRLRHYDQPIEPSLETIRWVRASTVPLLEAMTDDEWTRAGVHTERGSYTAEDWLELQAPHAHDHAAQIRRARGGN